MFNLFPRETLLINMPCCVNNFNFEEAVYAYTDLRISAYACRSVYVFKKSTDTYDLQQFYDLYFNLILKKVELICP